jgi:hypothetical protein
MHAYSTKSGASSRRDRAVLYDSGEKGLVRLIELGGTSSERMLMKASGPC